MNKDNRPEKLLTMAKRFNSSGSVSDDTLEELLALVTDDNKHPDLIDLVNLSKQDIIDGKVRPLGEFMEDLYQRKVETPFSKDELATAFIPLEEARSRRKCKKKLLLEMQEHSLPVYDIIIARSNATLDEALLIPSQGTKKERLAVGLANQALKQDEYFARILKANEELSQGGDTSHHGKAAKESLNGNYISIPEWVTSAKDFSIWVKSI